MNKQPRINCVLFDLDGTLIDTAADFLLAVKQLAEYLKIPPLSEAAVRQTVSDGARALLKRLVAENGGSLGSSSESSNKDNESFDDAHPQFSTLLQQLLDLYGQQIAHTQSTLYPGMDDLLQQLEAKRIPWGIVTNKPEAYAVPLLQKLGLLVRCKSLICPEHVKQRKPAAEPILLACQQLGCNPTRTVYIGDHERDILAAKNAGSISVAAAYGYLSADAQPESWQANHLLQNPEDACKLLAQLINEPSSC